MSLTRTRLGHAAAATGWLVSARAIGVGWRVLLVAQLGFAEFGVFAIVIAAATLAATPLDAYYLVRTPRIDDAQFAVDRSSRWWFGALLVVVGAIVTPVWWPAGLVLARAGAETTFNAYAASHVRAGRPDAASRLDLLRQAAAVAVAGGLLLAVDDPTVGVVTGAYVATFAVVGLLCFPAARAARPELPERTPRTGMIIAESVCSAAYINGDLLLLGALAGTGAAGQYSFATLVIWLIALVGQNVVTTYHEPLRAAGGDPAVGPPIRLTWALAGTGALGMAVVAVALATAGADRGLWLAFALLAVVAATRVWSAVCATVLALQHRDAQRLTMTVTGVTLKAAGVVALAGWGAPGAAVAFVVADLVITGWAARAVYGGRR